MKATGKRVKEGVVAKLIKRRMGYSSEEMATFLGREENQRVLAAAGSLSGKRLAVEVVEAGGCF